MTQTVLLQVLVLSAMMLLGFILGKRGYLKKEGVDLLTKLLMDVFLPCNVLAAASGDFSTGNLVQTAGIILLYYFFMLSFTALAAGVARLLRLSQDDMLVLSRSVGYPNNGFHGPPTLRVRIWTSGNCTDVSVFSCVQSLYYFQPCMVVSAGKRK